ncbi:hypothetical protein ACHAWF_012319 [Thalassiosira exigua]
MQRSWHRLKIAPTSKPIRARPPRSWPARRGCWLAMPALGEGVGAVCCHCSCRDWFS